MTKQLARAYSPLCVSMHIDWIFFINQVAIQNLACLRAVSVVLVKSCIG